MNKLSLGDALDRIKEKEILVVKLQTERNKVAVLTYDLGDDDDIINRPERDADSYTREIDFVNEQIRKLQLEITKANVNTVTEIVLNNENLLLGEVIMALRQFRSEEPKAKQLSENRNEKKKDKDTEYVDGQRVSVNRIKVRELQYDLPQVKERSKLLQKTISDMQSVVKDFNRDIITNFVDHDFVDLVDSQE